MDETEKKKDTAGHKIDMAILTVLGFERMKNKTAWLDLSHTVY